jgi:hypothetical protein
MNKLSVFVGVEESEEGGADTREKLACATLALPSASVNAPVSHSTGAHLVSERYPKERSYAPNPSYLDSR